MRKRILSIFLSLAMVLTLMPILPAAAYASAAVSLDEAQVKANIAELTEALSGKYFTVSGTACRTPGVSGHGCSNCDVVNVVATDWLKAAVKRVPSSVDSGFVHYYYSSAFKKGQSCCGFANFAGWYVFSGKSSDTVTFTKYLDGAFNAQTMANAKPGDIIRLGDSTSSGSHSAMVVSVGASSVTVLDCNWNTDSGNCMVTQHEISYSYYNYVTISRATNYGVHTHIYNWKYDEAKHWKECACGDETDAEAHSFTNAVTAPTCTEQGYTTHTCACGYSYIDSFTSELGHHYVDGVCSRCGAEDPNYRLSDVPVTSYFYTPVLWALENGITSGKTKTTFEPYSNCTRAQVVTFLWRANDCPEPETASCGFTDVSADAYYYKAVLWAVENGITSGYSKTAFGPGDTITRAQAVTFLWRAAGEPASTQSIGFSDVLPGSYYYTAVRWAVELGITGGYDSHTFAPNDGCTRAQIVTFLFRDSAL